MSTSTYSTRYIDALPEGTRLEYGGNTDRPIWTKCEGEWVGWQGIVPVEFVHAAASRTMTYPDAEAIPMFPAPLSVEMPSWATAAASWAWNRGGGTAEDAGGTWERIAEHAFGNAECGISVRQIQDGHENGTITGDVADTFVDIENIVNGADARTIGRWLLAAADLLDQINGIPTQRGSVTG